MSLFHIPNTYRQRESEIEKLHAEELAAGEMQFMHDKDALLTAASRAQEMLKERLAELQILYVYTSLSSAHMRARDER